MKRLEVTGPEPDRFIPGFPGLDDFQVLQAFDEFMPAPAPA